MRILLFFFLSFIVLHVSAQLTTGHTSVGVNGGGSVFAPCTEILDFTNYNDAVAGSLAGQNFVFILENGDSLFFNLTRTLYGMAAVTAPSYLGAAFGQFGYTGITGKTVLYQTSSASNSNLNFGNIHVKDQSGAAVSNYTMIIFDGEATNVGETLSTTLAPQSVLSFWDSITPPPYITYGLPPQTGIGTNMVTWGPAPESDNYKTAYSVSADTPGNIAVVITHVNSGEEGIAVGIKRRITGSNDTICSGGTGNIEPINAAPGTTYQWSMPTINPPGSITGATAQMGGSGSIQQILISNTGQLVSAVYTITPTSCGITAQPFNASITVRPSSAEVTPALCGDTTAQLIAIGPGTWSALSNNSAPSVIVDPNSDTTLVTGLIANDIYRYIRIGSGCTDTLTVSASYVATVKITPADTIFCAEDSTLICATTGFSSYSWNMGETGDCIEAKQAGDYYVTATDANGCTAESNHIAISVYPIPSVSIVVQGDTLTSFGSVTYHWYFNNSPINGANIPLYVAKQSGLYSLEVTDTNGCTILSNPVLITGVSELSAGKISISPNPSNGTWQLIVDNSFIGTMAELYDEDGRLVGSYKIPNAKCEITAILPIGVYWLRISSPEINVVRKLVKF